MTTEQEPMSGLEWKLAVVAVLGAVYTASWLAVAQPATRVASGVTRGDRRPAVVASAPSPRKATRVRTRSS